LSDTIKSDGRGHHFVRLFSVFESQVDQLQLRRFVFFRASSS
jgi:hypothetical protein